MIYMNTIPFQQINWSTVNATQHPGTTGIAFWKTVQIGGLRVRLVEYSRGYIADHWCQKGHVVYCITGSVTTEMENGESYILKSGMSYIVSDGMSSHRSVTEMGASLLIIDGDFLQSAQ
jgi:hypothetical protein